MTEISSNFTPLFDLPEHLNIPRTVGDLLALSRDPFFEGNALKQYVTDLVEATPQSRMRSLIAVSAEAICSARSWARSEA